MSKLTRNVIVFGCLIGGVTLIALPLWNVARFLRSQATEVVLEEKASPNGKWVATVTEVNGGATNAFVYRISLRSGSTGNPTIMAELRCRHVPTNPPLTIAWRHANHLAISANSARVLDYRSSWYPEPAGAGGGPPGVVLVELEIKELY